MKYLKKFRTLLEENNLSKTDINDLYNKVEEKIEKEVNLNDLEKYFYDNESKILSNIKEYGWTINRLKTMTNPYDLANVLGIDSRITYDSDVNYYANQLASLLSPFDDTKKFQNENLNKLGSYTVRLSSMTNDELLDELINLNQYSPEEMTADEIINKMDLDCRTEIFSRMK